MKFTLVAILILTTLVCISDEQVIKDKITISGRLSDAFHDPTDPFYIFFYVQTTNGAYYAIRQKIDPDEVKRIEESVGAQVTVTGQLVPCDQSFTRLYSGREIRVKQPDGFSIGKPAPTDRFRFPNEDSLWQMTPDNIAKQSFRCVRGSVLAGWDGDRVLIRMEKGRIVEAELRESCLPRFGETVDLVGLPETTLYNLHLNRAYWRSVTPPDSRREEYAKSLHAEAIVTDGHGRPSVNMSRHGQVLRLSGIVRNLPRRDAANGLMHLDDNGFSVPVNTDAARTALTDLEIGSTVEVTGICVMDVDVWRPNAVFPRIRGYTLITRSPDDIRILARPPWLTSTRALVICGILLTGLLGILLWNRALRIKSERRGRQLADEQILRAESELKVHERTRLAVELHDALSQSLAGVALELKTVAALLDADLSVAKEHLSIADHSLLSCREDLRNCLHDLRSNALEEADMNEAIRKTLAPHVDLAAVSIRFNVQRERISDKTAHAILCIVRELTLNAIRHGQATAVKIAGVIEDGKLLVSVRDNGSGFDTENHPGVRQGHFGLQGIQERIHTFNGQFTLVSKSGEGAKASLAINLPRDNAANG